MHYLFKSWGAKVLIVCMLCSVAAPAQAVTLAEVAVNLQALQNAFSSYLLSLLNKAPANSFTAGAGTVTTVSTDQELLNALATATGGEVIKLQPGRYGNITIDPGYSKLVVGAAVKVGVATNVGALSSQVTLTSADPNNRAVVGRIKLVANNIKIEGLSLRPTASGKAIDILASNISILKNDISFGNPEDWTADEWNATAGTGINVAAGEAQNIEIGYNYIKTVDTGINASKNTNIHHNLVEEFRGDGIRSKDNTIVEHNIVQNPIGVNGNHTDGYQSWSNGPEGVGTGVVYNVTLRNNTLINSTKPAPFRRTAMQGFGLFDGTYENWLIEKNLLVVNHTHGITINGSVNTIIRNNLVLDPDTLSPGPASSRFMAHKNGTPTVNGLLEGNYQQGPIQVSGNGVTSTGNVQVPFSDYDDYFVDHENLDYTLKPGAVPFAAGATIDRNQLAPEPYADGSNEPDPTPVPAPTVTFSVSPSSITTGNAASLTWSSTNATGCTASDDWSGTKSTSGSQSTGALTTVGNNTYTLTCTGTGGSQSKSVEVAVTTVPTPTPVPAPTVTFSVSPTSVTSGNAATLTWSSTNATACNGSGSWSGTKSTSGSQSTGALTTVGNLAYTLACTGTGGSLTKSVSVAVTASTPTPTPTPTNYVTAIEKVNVRATPNGTVLGTQPAGAKGVVVGSPVHSGAYDWVYVNFDTGHDGYVAQSYLQTGSAASTGTNPNQAKINEIMQKILLLQQRLLLLQTTSGQ